MYFQSRGDAFSEESFGLPVSPIFWVIFCLSVFAIFPPPGPTFCPPFYPSPLAEDHRGQPFHLSRQDTPPPPTVSSLDPTVSRVRALTSFWIARERHMVSTGGLSTALIRGFARTPPFPPIETLRAVSTTGALADGPFLPLCPIPLIPR